MSRLIAVFILCLCLAACASSGYRGSPYVYDDSARRCDNCGTVDRIERVYGGEGYATGSGAVLGAIVGGVLGSTVGDGDGQRAATAAGAIAGGLIGNEVEKDNNRGPRYEVFVTLDNGRRIVVRQDDLGPLRDGARVVVRNGRAERIR